MKKNPLTPPIVAPVVPELATKAHEGTPHYGQPSTLLAPAPPADHRAEGGNVYDLRNEQTTL